jgi:BirA family biotin operon repressor/biotin-[acetyl-CoA-carboxylase] ligase
MYFKIGGILIENSLKSDGAAFFVVGLNINQINFDNLPKHHHSVCRS